MKTVFFTLLTSFLVASFFVFPVPVLSVSCSEPGPNASLPEIQEIEDECSRLINESNVKIATLNQQINLMDNQIKLALVKIAQTEAQIKVVVQEIDVLGGKIVRLDGSLNYLSKVLLSRVEENFKAKREGPITLLFSSNNFSDFISRYRYLQLVQQHDRQLLLSMEQTRLSYDDQKKLKEKAQADLEKLNKQLVVQKQNLATQMTDKKKLLDETSGKEAEYQRILAAVKAEEDMINKSLQDSVLKLSNGTQMQKGQPIAVLGNTGYPCCSTGAHLHFMVTTGCERDDRGYIRNCTTVNPADFLKNTSVKYDSDVVAMNYKGDWDWPIDSPEITQEYGMSYWARTGYYGGKPHNGIDMVSSNSIIKAPKDGVLYRESSTCGGCNGKCCASVNFVILDHGNGVYSWYWHVK